MNSAGEVIGINSYKLSGDEGIGFAIPVNAAKPVLEQVISTGEFREAKLSVSLVDKELLSYDDSDIALDHGVYVYEVDASSDASAKGLKSGRCDHCGRSRAGRYHTRNQGTDLPVCTGRQRHVAVERDGNAVDIQVCWRRRDEETA